MFPRRHPLTTSRRAEQFNRAIMQTTCDIDLPPRTLFGGGAQASHLYISSKPLLWAMPTMS